MPALFLAMLAVTAAPAYGLSSTSSAESQENWDQVVRDTLISQARAERNSAAAAVGQLLDLRRRLAAAPELTPEHKRLLDRKIRRRLGQVPPNILAAFGAAAPQADPAARQSGAAALGDVIQQTIEPDSWDINGGPGHLSTYGP